MILETVKKELLTWDGVTEHEHRFGGIEFRYNNKELGHIHGDDWADIPFPKSIRDQLIEAGDAEPHHVLPNSGWITYRMKGEQDIPHVINLFKMQYDRFVKKMADSSKSKSTDESTS